MAKEGWLSRISSEGIKEFLWEVMRSWLVPILVPLVTAALGYAQNLPLMYIFIGAVSAFAFITHGLVKVTEWRFIRTPEHKLDFIEIAGGFDFDKNDAKKVTGVYLGVRLKTNAAFPIEVNLISLNTELGNRVPAKKGPGIKNLTVGIGGFCFFNDGAIDLSDVDLKNKEIHGRVSFKLKYGAVGNPAFEYKRDIDVTLIFDKDGYYSSFAWGNSVMALE
jgi:hypothetical protein